MKNCKRKKMKRKCNFGFDVDNNNSLGSSHIGQRKRDGN